MPADVDDATLAAAAAFRNGRRAPALLYYHRRSQGAIVGCSQPVPQIIAGRRSLQDEAVFRAIARTVPPGRTALVVLDEPSQAAKRSADRERADGYGDIRQWFMRLADVSAYRDSLARLVSAATDASLTSAQWLSRLGSCGWLQHVHALLRVALGVARSVARFRPRSRVVDARSPHGLLIGSRTLH